ncbi:MAG TPA: type II toxin-antitoxin system RelE/ParE family toxin [Methylocystis sp.]|nr:type II toxin-antitoxin system RelE/ParE family toxin [Methylocystis sp.]
MKLTNLQLGEYRLSAQASQQIREIGRFTKRRWGIYQAQAYHAGLERTFGLLADFPKMGVAVDELLAGARRFRFQSHNTSYTEDGGSILIRAVFHVSQALRPELFS